MKTKVDVKQADITLLEVDAIVNAANESLMGGGGVDGAIHRAAGTDLKLECRTLGGCPTGTAKITQGYHLPAKHIIHTVGPIWRGGVDNEAETLANCYKNSLQVALDNNLKTIAIPAISCGVYGYPIMDAVKIAVKTTYEFIAEHQGIERVTFVAFNEEIFRTYQMALNTAMFAPPEYYKVPNEVKNDDQ
ncbi:O-acetyl-ADP-ribose deacetylase [Candidatus Albibeggiatoa sp. nov. BB20]|uniref:O-acetyl-ADP-ribose deacetylase n=1 Tax=Candidatus Albibeggiatoa sp. nov. BB20 TaxID=3162723 RepID=UPI003365456B